MITIAVSRHSTTWVARLPLLFLLGLGQAWCGDDCDSKLRIAVAKAIRDDGYSRAITIMRNDERAFPTYAATVRKLVFYEVREGGQEIDETGRESLRIVDHPAEWRVFVDGETGRIYRMFGFKSGTEFSALVQSLGIKASATKAEWLAEGFIELAYSERAEVVHNAFEARRFIEDELYTALDPQELEAYMRVWLKRSSKSLDNLPSPDIVADGEGFKVRLAAARRVTRIGSQPAVDIRRVTLHVASDGTVTILGDDHIVSAHAPETE